MMLLELAERCEQAAGPDRELDAAVWGVACASPPCVNPEALGRLDWPAYTASIDAAMTLVPEGWEPLIDYTQRNPIIVELYGDGPIARGAAVTGPCALCAAALRARATNA